MDLRYWDGHGSLGFKVTILSFKGSYFSLEFGNGGSISLGLLLNSLLNLLAKIGRLSSKLTWTFLSLDWSLNIVLIIIVISGDVIVDWVRVGVLILGSIFLLV